MILDYYLFRVLHQQRLEEALRREPVQRMIREVERGRGSWKGRLLSSVRRHLSRLLTRRPTLTSSGRKTAARRKAAYVGCMDDLTEEISCRAA